MVFLLPFYQHPYLLSIRSFIVLIRSIILLKTGFSLSIQDRFLPSPSARLITPSTISAIKSKSHTYNWYLYAPHSYIIHAQCALHTTHLSILIKPIVLLQNDWESSNLPPCCAVHLYWFLKINFLHLWVSRCNYSINSTNYSSYIDVFGRLLIQKIYWRHYMVESYRLYGIWNMCFFFRILEFYSTIWSILWTHTLLFTDFKLINW